MGGGAASAAGGAPNDALSRIEALRRELDDLEAELQQASETGELCARRSRRLRERSSQLSEYALEKVVAGDEDAARSALRIKASVRDALHNATQRASANAALASKLEAVIESKQLQLLQRIREARADVERRRGAAAGGGGAAEEGARELRRASSSGGRRRGREGGGGGGAQQGGS
ncbi:hypothetical protein Rsub_10763 [Raphidocelis subcapitata]|uniref:Uncharacterized protein n=1 Tax=Raphidocelis subcapitata TaxID=307507 RepID=A0A2V0PET5_9CHLO|nr:hypothetical protein Rsub_10763 [Raphidocelis subcapitata]|eukprot:GBF98368.1 hypothetical protein Rsub_10763 [Raphidocelis subcapitata]